MELHMRLSIDAPLRKVTRRGHATATAEDARFSSTTGCLGHYNKTRLGRRRHYDVSYVLIVTMHGDRPIRSCIGTERGSNKNKVGLKFSSV